MKTFEVVNGLKIGLADSVVAHIPADHPEMASYLDWIERILANPVAILPDPYRPNAARYYGFVPSAQKYMRVAVKILPDEAWVSTAFLTNEVK